MAERRTSLRARLLALPVAASGAVWIMVAAATFFDAQRQTERLFDAQLTEYSEVLSAIAGHEAHEIEGEVTELEHEYAQTLAYQVYTPGGGLLMRSHAAPERALSDQMGFSNAESAGGRWRVYRRFDQKSGLVLIVAQRTGTRRRNTT